MTHAWILVATAVAGCADRHYQECSTGLLCPEPKVCAEPSGLCVSQPQITACEGQPEGAACSLQPAQTSLNALWAASATDVFAVGDAGTILRFDGAVWHTMDSGATSQLNGVWGTDASNVFAVGDEATAYHFDGTRWRSLTTDAVESIEAVFGIGGEIWSTGDQWIGKFDGTGFTRVETGISLKGTSIWGAGSELFIGTDAGTAVRYDGAAWREEPLGLNEIAAIWGTSVSNVFVAAANGGLTHWNGSAWTMMSSGITLSFEDVHGPSPTSVFAVAARGILLHFDGVAWTQIPSGTTANLNAIVTVGSVGLAVGEGGAIIEGVDLTWKRSVTDGQCTTGVCQAVTP